MLNYILYFEIEKNKFLNETSDFFLRKSNYMAFIMTFLINAEYQLSKKNSESSR